MGADGAALPLSLMLFLLLSGAVGMLLIWHAPTLAGYLQRRWQGLRRRRGGKARGLPGGKDERERGE